MNKRISSVFGLFAIAFLLLSTGKAMALEARKPDASTLAAKEFFKPELHISSSNIELQQALATLPNRGAWSTFVGKFGQPQVYLDPRSGVATSVVTRIPMIPGQGVDNAMSLTAISDALGRKVIAIDRGVVGDLLRKFVIDNGAALGVDSRQLGAAKAEKVTDTLWNVRIPQFVNGVPVRFAQLVAVINNGNLTLIGAETWGNAVVDTVPFVREEEVAKLAFTFAGGRTAGDTIWEKPSLEIVPIAPQEYQSGEAFAGPVGVGYQHRLVWSFGFERQGEDGRFEALIDARTGEVVSFEDRNLYETKKMTGGVYPLTDTEVCPANDRCGTMQSNYPMPFADTGLAAPNDFSNSAGLFNYSSGTVTSHLAGKYVAITDTCGAVAETASGDLIFGGVNGQHDCVSAGASAGDTAASRSAFYEINKLKEMARGWLPANAWLQAQLITNVNLPQTCNAFYSPANGTVNFYKSGGGCRNSGEIAAVFDHEWGHGLDDNDTGGTLSNSSEIYADITAVLRLQAACVGYGFFQTIDQGCGQTADGTGFNGNESQVATPHCNLDCSGVRGADWNEHADHNPDTPTNFICTFCGSGSGPCGREVHCENAPGNQTAWDLANRDLEAAPFNMPVNDAFIVANKVFYQGSGLIGNWETCTCPGTSNGCGATNAYLQWLAADDDDGNLNNGTPHMTAIFSAFNRHGIACATPTVQNSGCAGGPTTAPNLSISVGSNSLNLSWSSVPGATSYRVLRSEGFGGCDFGKAVIAEVPGLSYTDPDVANGRPANYVVQAVGSNSACFGPSSACVTGVPQPCAGSVSLTQELYNCGGAPLNITVIDGDLVGHGSQAVSISSNTEHGPETLVLTETPANSGIFKGTFGTTTSAPVGGDGQISIADGDSIAVDYLDVDYCGTPNVTVSKFASVDCSIPIITNVQVANITGHGADVTFTTNEPTDAVAHYGTTPPPGSVASNPTLTTSHTVHIDGLTGCTAWVVSVSVTDPAGNAASDNNGGAYYGFITLANVTPTYAYPGPPVALPDVTTTTSSFNIADARIIQDVSVKIGSLTHTYDGDLILTLIAPNATRIQLSNRRGTSGDNFTNTVFDDEATTPIASGTAPFTGSFKPEVPLSGLDGISANGTWSLEVQDAASGDSGVLTSWELQFEFPAEQCPTVGQVNLDRETYTCSQTVQIHVVDFSIVGAGTQPVTIASTTETTPETVVLSETPANSGSFIGTIPLTTSAAAHGDGLLSIANGDSMTVTYIDADDGYGNLNVPRTDTATVDCVGPTITNVQAINIIADSADITFTTSEPGDTVVVYGSPTPGTTVSSGAFVTSHTMHLTGLAACTTYYYYVNSTDPVGNSVLNNNGGANFVFYSDCSPPVITNVHTLNLMGTSVDVAFDTNEPANTTVYYGTTTPPGTPVSNPAFVTSHTMHLSGLAQCTDYYFYVVSADPVGNSAAADNGGVYYFFTTPTNNNPSYPYTGPPVPIPDNNPTGGTATITVPDNQVIQDLNVTITSLTHTYDGDIAIHLIGPDNTDVMLSNKRGTSGDNYTNTVFDDQGVTPIASGTAPFTGTFIPDAPLSAFNGKIAAGTWKLFVVDNANVDSGLINAFSLNFTFPPQACNAPHAIFNSATTLADSCSSGGAGAGNSIWEPGENVQFKINITADGTAQLTNVSATIASTTAGVTMVMPTASFPNLGVGASADSNAPHFTAHLPTSLTCGSTVDFQVTIHANQGTWVGNFSHGVGQVISGSGTALSENFAAGIPATWTVVDGGVGGGAAATWTTANPGNRTAAAPMVAPFAIVDSDNAGSTASTTQDEQLITPVVNLSTALTANVNFDQYFQWYSGGLSEIADVDVRSSLTGGNWVNVLRQQNASSPNPDHKVIDITAQAAGAADVQVRFHYYQAHYEWWWQVDNVKVDYTAPGGCNQNVCTAAPGVAKPVADGSFGTAMKGSRGDAPGSIINLTWDVSTCSSTDHHVLYGPLAGVSSSTVSGAYCNIGTSGTTSWTGVPAGNLWFVVVGDDDATTEGSWGTMTSGQRGGAAVSGQCGLTVRSNAGTCP